MMLYLRVNIAPGGGLLLTLVSHNKHHNIIKSLSSFPVGWEWCRVGLHRRCACIQPPQPTLLCLCCKHPLHPPTLQLPQQLHPHLSRLLLLLLLCHPVRRSTVCSGGAIAACKAKARFSGHASIRRQWYLCMVLFVQKLVLVCRHESECV